VGSAQSRGPPNDSPQRRALRGSIRRDCRGHFPPDEVPFDGEMVEGRLSAEVRVFLLTSNELSAFAEEFRAEFDRVLSAPWLSPSSRSRVREEFARLHDSGPLFFIDVKSVPEGSAVGTSENVLTFHLGEGVAEFLAALRATNEERDFTYFHSSSVPSIPPRGQAEPGEAP